jgi:hypothetical protein
VLLAAAAINHLPTGSVPHAIRAATPISHEVLPAVTISHETRPASPAAHKIVPTSAAALVFTAMSPASHEAGLAPAIPHGMPAAVPEVRFPSGAAHKVRSAAHEIIPAVHESASAMAIAHEVGIIAPVALAESKPATPIAPLIAHSPVAARHRSLATTVALTTFVLRVATPGTSVVPAEVSITTIAIIAPIPRIRPIPPTIYSITLRRRIIHLHNIRRLDRRRIRLRRLIRPRRRQEPPTRAANHHCRRLQRTVHEKLQKPRRQGLPPHLRALPMNRTPDG